MSDKLDVQIKAVEAKIVKVEGEIEKVTTRLEELNKERRVGQVVQNERLDRGGVSAQGDGAAGHEGA